MATKSCCQLCEGHKKEWEIARSTLSALQREVDELKNERIGSANEQLDKALRREKELHCLLDEAKRENQSLRATIQSSRTPVHATSAEPPRVSQDTGEVFPGTPAQLIPFRHISHDIPGTAVLTIEIPTGVANGAMALSSGNLETLDNKAVSELVHSLDGSIRLTPDVELISPHKVVDTLALPVISKLESLPEFSFNPGLSNTWCDLPLKSGIIGKSLTELLEVKTQKQGDVLQHDKKSQSYETQPKIIEHQMNPAEPPSHEIPANSGSQSSRDLRPAISGSSHGTRKRRRLNLVQAASDDEDYVTSPPSKKKLFMASFDNLAVSNAIPVQKGTQQPESPGRAAVVEMEFGGGITVSELAIEDPEVDREVTPKPSLNRLRRKSSVELPSATESVELPRANATEEPVQVGLRRSNRLSQSAPMTTNDHSEEDEIESSDEDSSHFSVAESSASSKETHEPSKSRDKNIIQISTSDSEPDPSLRRRVRPTRNKHTQPQGIESSESPQSSSSSDKAVNLLRSAPDDEEDDNDDEQDSLSDFIVNESSSSEENASSGEEQISDSDFGEDSSSQGTFRERIVRKRQNRIWEFEGDLLAAIQTNNDIALQAICALYRQQTNDEKYLKSALHRNGRGFDSMNAQWGSNIAEFLIDGDEFGQLKKSAVDLETRFPGAVEICQSIAAHHSKQLFEIYSNNEDPFWRKSTGQAA